MYTRARERQAETFIDQCVDIADMVEHGTVTKIIKNGLQKGAKFYVSAIS